jgi:hypothetical protein
MPGKRMWLTAVMLAVVAGSGCCRWCERWCGTHASAPVMAAPACVPVCVPQCPPGTIPAASAGQWQRGPYCCP